MCLPEECNMGRFTIEVDDNTDRFEETLSGTKEMEHQFTLIALFS